MSGGSDARCIRVDNLSLALISSCESPRLALGSLGLKEWKRKWKLQGLYRD